MRWATRIVVILVVVAALVLGFCVYSGISTSLHAEHVLHAALLTIQLLDEYVDQHEGDWPSSWAELEELPNREGGMYEWPADSLEVQQYVSVDFSADPERLLRQKVGEFDAVLPIGSYYPFQDSGQVIKLLETISKHSAD